MSRSKISPSYQQSLFADADLKHPVHDTITEWAETLCRDDPGVLDQFFPGTREPDYELVVAGEDGLQSWLEARIHRSPENALSIKFLEERCKELNGSPASPEPTTFVRSVWEQPVRLNSEAKREDGFVDLRIFLERSTPRGYAIIETVEVRPYHEIKPGTGYLGDICLALGRVSGCLATRGRELVVLGPTKGRGFGEPDADISDWIEQNRQRIVEAMGEDAVINKSHLYKIAGYGWDMRKDSKSAYLEIKTEVRSKGELIRQLRFYSARGANPLIVVCPPISGLGQLLKEQGFGYIAYDPMP